MNFQTLCMHHGCILCVFVCAVVPADRGSVSAQNGSMDQDKVFFNYIFLKINLKNRFFKRKNHR